MSLVFLLITAAVFVGASAQRLTGMGFALVVSPFLVLLLGPVAGVMIVNACGVVSSAIVWSRTHRDVDWRLVRILVLFALLGVIPGGWLSTALPGPVMHIVIGLMIVLALTISLTFTRSERAFPQSMPVTGSAGLASGFMSAAAGVGGPALSVFAILTRWEHRAFAATMQPYFVAAGLMALGSKLLFEPTAWPTLPAPAWLAMAIALLAGQVFGEWLSTRIPVSLARLLMIVLAFGGGIATLAKGIIELA